MGVLHQPSEFVAHPQTRTREFFTESGVEGLEGLPFATQPVKLARTPSSIRRGRVGRRRAEFAATPRRRAPLGRGRDLLLDGVRVIEFGVAAVVPEMCAVLSELGADVIKIESRANLDVLRMGSGSIELIDKNFTFNDECRGRRSVALDLNTERGRELALALCASADVVAENQRGGALERRGLGYDAVRGAQPARRLRVVAGLRPRRPVRRDARLRTAQLRLQRRAPALEPPRRARIRAARR